MEMKNYVAPDQNKYNSSTCALCFVYKAGKTYGETVPARREFSKLLKVRNHKIPSTIRWTQLSSSMIVVDR